MEAEPLRVLLVEDNPGDARLLRESLAEAPAADFELIHVERVSQALLRLTEERFDAVLSDLSLPDSQGLETFAKLHGQAPEVPILVLTSLDDEILAVRAVEEGAQDYLVKGQVDGKILLRSVRYAIGRQHAQAEQLQKLKLAQRGKAIGFFGVKGGVRTTTVALNVAAILSQPSKTVLAVELRPSCGGFSLQTNKAPPENLRHLLELDPDRIDHREVRSRLVHLVSGLSLLYGPQRAGEFKEIEPDRGVAILRALVSMGDYVVIDFPAVPSSASAAAVGECDFVALVLEPEQACVAAGRGVLELLQAWGVSGSLVGAIVVNRGASSVGMKITDIRAQLGCGILGAVPAAAEALSVAQKGGTPLALAQPSHLASLALVEIANRLAADQVVAMNV